MESVQHKFDVEAIQKGLSQFIGTTKYYRLSPLFPRFILTDGTRYVLERCEASWLFSVIADLQLNPEIKDTLELRHMQFWTLSVNLEESNGILFVESEREKVHFQTSIPCTDFPLEKIRIYVAATRMELNGKVHHVAYLPSEH